MRGSSAPCGRMPHTSTSNLSWNDVSQRVIEWMHIDVARVNWFSTYRVHHRVADHFRKGRAFLLGDAAHIHSPVGGQGMNTGIGDAVNLAWKLAAVLQGRADASILDSYEPERIAFARRLVATTDRGLHGRDKPRADRAARASADRAAPGPGAFRVRGGATLHVPHGLADGGELPRQQPERWPRGSGSWR